MFALSLALAYAISFSSNKEERVSLISQEASHENPSRDDQRSRASPPEFRFKISSWLYPKIYIHSTHDRCIRNATSLQYIRSTRFIRGPSTPTTELARRIRLTYARIAVSICVLVVVDCKTCKSFVEIGIDVKPALV